MPFNTFTTSDDYSRHNRDNLPLLIQTQLSKKLKTFCCFFIAFLESKLNLQHFEKNWTSKCKYFWNQWFQNLVTETYKSFVSEKPFSFKRVKLENKKKNKKNSRTINNSTTLNRAEQNIKLNMSVSYVTYMHHQWAPNILWKLRDLLQSII